MRPERGTPVLSADLLLRAYAQGWFPMMHEDGEHYWHDPDPRAIFPLGTLKVDRGTRKLLAPGRFCCSIDQDFEAVMRACADPDLPGRDSTWISGEMIAAYIQLHRLGHAHSVEVHHGEALVGGIYGVCLGGAFFGESMFSRASGAGRIAFHHLAGHLRQQRFTLFDTQYINPHTRLLGAVEIPREEFKRRLSAALSLPVRF